MTYNSFIILKAIRQPIILSEREAMTIKKDYDDDSVPENHRFDLKFKSFSKSEIKYIEIVKDGSSGESWNARIHDENVKGWEKRQEFLRKTPEDKAKHLDMFRYMFKISTDREPTPVELKRAELAQLEFYKENPTRTICEFNLLLR